MKIEQIQMTPALAAKLLQKNTANRNLSQGRVSTYAAAMTADEWVPDGSPIRIGESGALLDGQHRLAAVVRSGRTIPMIVISGLPDESQLTIDTGKGRTFAHVLEIRGHTDASTVAATTTALWNWQNGAFAFVGSWVNRPTPTHHVLWELLQKRETEIRLAISMARAAKRFVQASPGVMGAGYVMLSDVSSEDADDFYEQLACKRQQTPAVALLTRTMNNRATPVQAKGLAGQTLQTVYLIKAWNAYRDGIDPHFLRWMRGGSNREAFPEPK
jgi:hypothetical protein